MVHRRAYTPLLDTGEAYTPCSVPGRHSFHLQRCTREAYRREGKPLRKEVPVLLREEEKPLRIEVLVLLREERESCIKEKPPFSQRLLKGGPVP